MLTFVDIASRGLIAASLVLAILFVGGATQVIQLGVVTLMLLGVLARLNWSIRHEKIYWSRVHTALAAYAALLVINIYTSVFAENSLHIAWLFLAMPMAVLVCGRPTDEYWKILLPLLCIPMMFSVFWGYTEFFLGTGRATGPMIDPNSWASGLNLFFFILAAWFFKADGRTAGIMFILLGLIAAATFMAYSRVGNLVFFGALAVVVLVALSRHAFRRRAIVLVLLVAGVFYSVHGYRSPEAATRHQEGYTLNIEAHGWSQRLAQWRSGLAQYRDHPVMGSGLGTFKILYPRYRTLDDARTAGNHMHNDYLQLLTEGGPLLLAFVLSLAAFLIWQLTAAIWRLTVRSRQARERDQRKNFEIVVLVMALATVFVHAMMNFTFYVLLNQLLMGCVLARLLWLTGFTREKPLKLHSPRLVRGLAVLAVIYVLTLNYADAISSDLVYQGGLVPLDRTNPEEQLVVYDILSVIRQFRGNQSANQFAMATFYRKSFDAQPPENVEGRRSLAIVTALEYQTGLELNPYNLQIRRYFAEFLDRNPWLMELEAIYQTPEQLLRAGLAQAPFQIHRHVMLADYLAQHQRDAEAYEVLKGALKWAPMRYEDYQHWRLNLYLKLLNEARARGDEAVLQDLLQTMQTVD